MSKKNKEIPFVLKQVFAAFICTWVKTLFGLIEYKSSEKSPGYLSARIQ